MIGRQVRSIVDLAVTVSLVAWLRVPQKVDVLFEDVPREATSFAIWEWTDDGAARERVREALQGTSPVRVSYRPGAVIIVMFTRADGAYVVDGPFTWPEQQTTRTMDQQWRRSVQSAGNAALRGASLEWVGTGNGSGPWPRCAWLNDQRVECIGVPLHAAGVIASETAGRVAWSVVAENARDAPVMRQSRWGRLLRVQPAEARAPSVTVRRLVAPPAYRLRTIRLETSEIAASVIAVGGDATWIAGDDESSGAWAEVSTGSLGPAVVPLKDLVAGPVTLPFVITLEDPSEIRGVIRDSTGVPVASALIALFRLVDPPESAESTARGEPRARRVGAGQLVTAADGAFAFGRLPAGDFELVAWQGQLGRSSLLVRAPDANVTMRLAPAAVARGRVLMRGHPVPGAPVVSVPDSRAVSTSDDLTELKGGDGRTAADGRFAVALAASGGGELRIGGDAWSVRRVRLPATPGTSVDLGDIELPVPHVVTLVLDQDPGCGLTLVGPLGHAGLQIVTARRTGPGTFEATVPEEGDWRATLTCGTVERAVAPALLKIGAGTQSVNLQVR